MDYKFKIIKTQKNLKLNKFPEYDTKDLKSLEQGIIDLKEPFIKKIPEFFRESALRFKEEFDKLKKGEQLIIQRNEIKTLVIEK